MSLLNPTGEFETRANRVQEQMPIAFATSPLSNTGPILHSKWWDMAMLSVKTDEVLRGEYLEIEGADPERITYVDEDQRPVIGDNDLPNDHVNLRGDDSSLIDYESSRYIDELAVEIVDAQNKNVMEEEQKQLKEAAEKYGVIEAVAWYHPIHIADDTGRWGITIHEQRFRSLVRDFAGCGVNYGQAAVALYQGVLRHELFHHRVECFALEAEEYLVTPLKTFRTKAQAIYLEYTGAVYKPGLIIGTNLEEGLATAETVRGYQNQAMRDLWVSCFGDDLPGGYDRFAEFIRPADFTSGTDLLAAQIIRGQMSPVAWPARFPRDSRTRREQVPMRIVGVTDGVSLLGEMARLFRPGVDRFSACLAERGARIENVGRGPHPYKVVFKDGFVISCKVGTDGRIREYLINEVEAHLGLKRDEFKRCLLQSRKQRRIELKRVRSSSG